MSTWQHAADRDLMRLGSRLAMFTHGEGSRVWDVEGNRYLDFLGGIAVNALGHAHPAFVDAVAKHAATLTHVSNYFTTPQQLELAARLKRLAGTGESGRVFLANSGAEANETAIKLARLHSRASEQATGTARPKLVSINGAFHGRTMGTLSITPTAAYQDPFRPFLPDVVAIDPTLDELERVVDEAVAAVFIEPIQGEAGVVPMPDGFIRAAREITSKHGALLILDEVQSGAGRTGEWFAFQREDVVPDAITLAKALGGGIPIGATITFGYASELFVAGTHNSTFGGNPLASGVANAVLQYIEDHDLLSNVKARGEHLRAAVAEMPHVVGTRGAGLLIGIQLDASIAADVRAAAHEAGLIVNAPRPDTIRLAPAFTIGDDEVDEFTAIFGTVLRAAPSAPGAS